MAMAQNDRNPRITQKAFEVVGDVYGFSTVREVTSTIAARRVRYQSSDECSTIMKPIVYPINPFFGDARPFIGHADRFERSNKPAISCDEAFKRYGGVLIKESFGGARLFIGQSDRFKRSNEGAISCDEAFQRYGGMLMKKNHY
ncbi:hypothetical protein V5N11_031553 [Cardamine amara subsp. amara]|uniref:Uncharacterized protein n=1 Tax=Cardamine amara subsp. amara TaxID=228776 RepID=A0ABD0ZJ95_CARAN